MSASANTRPPASALVDPDATANAGINALKDGTEEQIVGRLEAAARVHPDHPRLLQVLGLVHRNLDQLAPAVAALRTAASLAPDDPLIAHGVAQAHKDAGLPATEWFDRALRLAPSSDEVMLGRAGARMEEGGPAAVIPEIEAIVEKHPGWMPGQGLLAQLRWIMGDRDGFTRGYEQALTKDSGNILIWRDLVVKLIHADRFGQALDAIGRGRAAIGPHPVFENNAAVCLDELGDHAGADALYASSIPINHINLVVRRVRNLLRLGRTAEAAALAEQWTGDPAADLIWPYLSIAWRMMGDARWQWLEGDERLVGHFDVADQLPDIDGLAALLRKLHKATHQPLEQSVRGGTQTEGVLLRRIEPEIRSLRAAIVGAVESYIAGLPPVDPAHPFLRHRRDRPVRFAGSWSVRLARQGHHANHIHPQGWISSAFYVALPDEAERGPSPAGWLQLGTPQSELGIDLPPTRMIEPKPGRLALFPSTMWHGTVPFDAGERLTVAFDVARPR